MRAFALAYFAFAVSSTEAGTSTWNGNGGDVNWSTAGNWTGGTPLSSTTTDVIFAGTINTGTAGAPLNQNIASPMTLSSLTFSSGGGAFFLGGGALDFSGVSKTITQNSSSAESIANNISPSVNGTTTVTLAGSGTGLVTLSGIISKGTNFRDYAILKTGASTFSLTGVNTYSGGTTINGGTLIINNSASLGATSGGLTLNAGTLEVATGFSTTRAITLGNAASTFQIDPSQTYTVTGVIGGSGILNKTGTGTMVLSGNNTYSGGTSINGGTLALASSGAIGSSGTISFGGGTLQYSASNTTDYSGRFSNALSQSYSIDTNGQNVTLASALSSSGGTFTKLGAGTLVLSGVNTYTGGTTVSGGTLTAAASSGSALGSTSSITVNSGGTLLLGASDQINNSATMTLAGGTFAKGNFSEGSTSTAGVGALTLTASGSHIDVGTGTVGTITFASFTPNGNSLTIDNWTGTANTVGSASTDRLIFNSDQTSNLSCFSFTGYYSGAVEFALGNDYYEVTPVTPVPEPATYVAGVLALGALAYSQRRRLIRLQL